MRELSEDNMSNESLIVILVVATVCALKSAFQRAAVSTQTQMRADAARGSASFTTNREILSATSPEDTSLNKSAVELGRPASELSSPGNDSRSAASLAEKDLLLETEHTINFTAVPNNRLQGLQTAADAENSPVLRGQ